MEAEVIERLEKAYDMVREKEIAHNEKWRISKEEWYTPEVREMLETITNKTHQYMVFGLDDGYEMFIDNHYIKFYKNRGQTIDLTLDKLLPDRCSHNDETIRLVERHVNDLNTAEIVFNNLTEKIPEIIKRITEVYKITTENQMSRLDDIFAMLDVDEQPIKHVKVTVEWV